MVYLRICGVAGIWPMPLEPAYRQVSKDTIADLKNAGVGKGGGSITAALFLQEFVTEKVKWAHIDMAGPCWDSNANVPTGYGVKTLVDFVLNAAEKGLKP